MIGAASPGEQAWSTCTVRATFFGARSLGEEIHNATATALLQSAIVRVSKSAVRDLLRTDPMFVRQFAIHMMRRAAR
jgi:CRP-like cAMP-binding protein